MKEFINKIGKINFLTFISAFISGLIIHMFGLTNILHNHDSIYRVPDGYGTGVRSGRWLLTIIGDLVTKAFGNYNMSWVNGVIFIILLAFSATIVVSVFEIKSKISAIFIGILFVSFPSVASTMFYRFTVIYYGISILFSVLAVYIIEKRKYGLPISVILIACGMGIYQSYVPLTIALFVVLLIKKNLVNLHNPKEVFLKGIYYMIDLILGFFLYFFLMKMSLWYYNTSLTNYQGINEMGILSIKNLPSLIKETFISFVSLPLNNYLDLAQTALIRYSYIILGIITIVVLALMLIRIKKITNSLLCIILCLTFPVAVNFIVIMCHNPESYIYTLMAFPFVLVLCVPFILWEIFPENNERFVKIKGLLIKCIAIFTAVIVFSYSYQANQNYTLQYYTNRQIENYLNGMITQVRMTKGFDTDKKWAFLGKIDDPLLSNEWDNVEIFGGNQYNKTLINSRRNHWIETYIGIEVPVANDLEIEILKENVQVKNMPCWPNEGSILVVDNYIVIKLQNID